MAAVVTAVGRLSIFNWKCFAPVWGKTFDLVVKIGCTMGANHSGRKLSFDENGEGETKLFYFSLLFLYIFFTRNSQTEQVLKIIKLFQR